jgi:hypothetical protein
MAGGRGWDGVHWCIGVCARSFERSTKGQSVWPYMRSSPIKPMAQIGGCEPFPRNQGDRPQTNPSVACFRRLWIVGGAREEGSAVRSAGVCAALLLPKASTASIPTTRLDDMTQKRKFGGYCPVTSAPFYYPGTNVSTHLRHLQTANRVQVKFRPGMSFSPPLDNPRIVQADASGLRHSPSRGASRASARPSATNCLQLPAA